jgi:D-psicose/D-tagatose/L-ribulose 3-epimerase
MPRYGTHPFTLEGDWNNRLAPQIIALAAELGFDFLEIPVFRPSEFDAPLIGRHLEMNGIYAVGAACLPKDCHIPANPGGALRFLREVVDCVADFGGKLLSGGLYCSLATLTGSPPTAEERARCVEVLSKLHSYASEKGVQLGLEPISRYETYLYNTVADILEAIEQIGADDILVHLDTYHMNLEEDGLATGIRKAGWRAGYCHLSESHRGLPGEGTVDWNAVFGTLKEIGYQGPLVLEAFGATNQDLIVGTCLWRKSKYTPRDLAVRGLRFLKAKAAEFKL